MRMRQRFGRLLLATSLTLLVAACGGADGQSGAASATSAAPSTTAAAAVSPLVGEWRRTHRCEEVLEILRKAGFKEQVAFSTITEEGFLPGVSSASGIADVKHPCRGAVPHLHSHFFTADGQFGSKDQNGQQVDDGTYKIVVQNSRRGDSASPSPVFNPSWTGSQASVQIANGAAPLAASPPLLW